MRRPGFYPNLVSYAVEVEDKSLQMMKDTALEILINVANSTPVKTGRLASNWVVRRSGARPTWVDRKPGIAGRQISIENGRRHIRRYKTLGDIFIMNSVPYAKYVNALYNMTGLAISVGKV